MNHIPTQLNEELNNDKYYTKCCLAKFGGCEGRIERHHALIFAGRQLQAKFCILPACHAHHELARHKDWKEKFDWVLLNRATDEEIQSISKATNYQRVKQYLNQKYGTLR